MSNEKQNEETGVTLGQHLAQVRAGKKLSLRQVEEATNKEVSNAYLSQIENDKIKQPSPNILNALAELYAIDFQELMRMAGYVRSSANSSGDARHGRVGTFAEYNLTGAEESALVEYLQFIRGRKKPGDQS